LWQAVLETSEGFMTLYARTELRVSGFIVTNALNVTAQRHDAAGGLIGDPGMHVELDRWPQSGMLVSRRQATCGVPDKGGVRHACTFGGHCRNRRCG
jgi:hypothetical protein